LREKKIYDKSLFLMTTQRKKEDCIKKCFVKGKYIKIIIDLPKEKSND